MLTKGFAIGESCAEFSHLVSPQHGIALLVFCLVPDLEQLLQGPVSQRKPVCMVAG